MKVSFSKKALEDLEQIWLYTSENWSIAQADRYYNNIMDEVESLAVNPSRGRDYNHVRKNYRVGRIQSHLIFYRIRTPKKEIEVVRILHQSMDIESHLDA